MLIPMCVYVTRFQHRPFEAYRFIFLGHVPACPVWPYKVSRLSVLEKIYFALSPTCQNFVYDGGGIKKNEKTWNLQDEVNNVITYYIT